ncbi:hypothetical protein GCM10022197_22500 [Microlunatus spumicola]|uniref:HTH merR-type domain-containing protein n=1 Tax=Microlunatus spumicola TaxID=81499 RepID=A0ABP6XEW9_9ACTN
MSPLRIAEVAARSGVPASTLRYYDQLGLVRSGRLPNGYRSYPDSVFDRLRFIDSARKLDLPLEDIAGLLAEWEAGPCASAKARLRPLLSAQLTTVDDAVDTLTELRDHLHAARAHLDELPDRDEQCDPSCGFLLHTPAAPVVCRLGAERSGQVDRWHALLAETPAERLNGVGGGGGVRYRLPVTALADTAALAAAEQACCPFFRFDLSLRHDTFTLTIRTPPKGLPLLAEITGLPDLVEAP